MAHSSTTDIQTVRTSEDAGQLTCNKFVFDFAAAYAPAAIDANDTITIGVIPAGERAVPHLCRIDIPALDTDGSPTGDYQIGTADDPDALKGSAASETAVTLFGEDFILSTAEVGSKSEPTPIIITAIAASATVPTSGKIVCWLVSRPWDSRVDG